MNHPPCLMRIHISKPDFKLNLWLPLFLLLPVIFVILIILAPVALLAAVILWPFGWGKWLLIVIPTVFVCLCAIRGLEVEIAQSNEKVHIYMK